MVSITRTQSVPSCAIIFKVENVTDLLTQLLTDSIGSRDASASKNSHTCGVTLGPGGTLHCGYQV